jgi:2,4-dienoyl-CoA reductase-like NADH-dependent reductase (Old Yellow Enzyme family)
MTPPDVYAPARLGPVTLRNRVIKAATFEGRTPHALVTEELIEYHLRPARGGVGMTTVAYCAVSPEGRTDRHQIWMRPEAVPGLRRLTEAVHAEGAARSLCIHCNKCMPTIYRGTHCVLAGDQAGQGP